MKMTKNQQQMWLIAAIFDTEIRIEYLGTLLYLLEFVLSLRFD